MVLVWLLGPYFPVYYSWCRTVSWIYICTEVRCVLTNCGNWYTVLFPCSARCSTQTVWSWRCKLPTFCSFIKPTYAHLIYITIVVCLLLHVLVELYHPHLKNLAIKPLKIYQNSNTRHCYIYEEIMNRLHVGGAYYYSIQNFFVFLCRV